MKQIADAFVKAQKGFGSALKTKTNHNKGKYADLVAVVEAVIDALHANNIALIQTTHECSDGVIVETLFLHSSGETLSGGRLHVPSAKQDAQAYGSALTYARRYSLMAACGIAPEDDDGNAASAPSEKSDEYQAYEDKHLDNLRNASINGAAELKRVFDEIPDSSFKKRLWTTHSASLKKAAGA